MCYIFIESQKIWFMNILWIDWFNCVVCRCHFSDRKFHLKILHVRKKCLNQRALFVYEFRVYEQKITCHSCEQVQKRQSERAKKSSMNAKRAFSFIYMFAARKLEVTQRSHNPITPSWLKKLISFLCQIIFPSENMKQNCHQSYHMVCIDALVCIKSAAHKPNR